MTVQDLKKLSNEKIQFSVSSDSVVIRSWNCKYVDMVHVVDIESVEIASPSVVRISVPVGTWMGDREILANLSTGIVTADGKAFDEPMPESVSKFQTRKKTQTTFTPSINGFSIKSVKTMPSKDGYALYCNVYFNDKKIGDFVDKGDGGEYSFYADKPYSTSKIESVVRSFPPVVRDYGFGLIETEYSIGILVDDLLEMRETAKHVKKLEGTGRNYLRIDDWKSGRHLYAEIPSNISDQQIQ